MNHDPQALIVQTVQAAADQRRLTLEEIARRAGVSKKTVRRFLGGHTFSVDTAAKLARALRVDMDSVRPKAHTNAHERTTMPTDAQPVSGWKVAAQIIGVHRNHLLAVRRERGETRRPWWPSRDAVLAWYTALVVGGSGGTIEF